MKHFRRPTATGDADASGGVKTRPPETRTALGAATAIPSRVHAEFRRQLRSAEIRETAQAAAFTARHYPNLERCWQDHPDEMEWNATVMYSEGHTAVAEKLCAGRDLHQPRKTPPDALTLRVSKTIASAADPGRSISHMLAAVD